MQSNITLKNIRRALKLSFATLFLFTMLVNMVNAQTTVTATQTPTTVSSQMTFNFTNTTAVPVVISTVAAGLNSAAGTQTNVSGYYKASAIAGAPGAITTANGWTQFGAATVAAAGTNANQQFFTSSLTIPAGATYGITLNAVLASDNTTTGRIIFASAGTTTFTAGGCTITTGPNVTYVGNPVPAAPTATPYYVIAAVTFTAGTPCSGTPAPGNTVSSVTGSCTGVGFTLSTQNTVPAGTTGITYQYQSSSSPGGPFTNIPGATNATYTTTQTAATYYQVVVTCANGGGTATSNPIFVPISTQCYCAATATDTNPLYEKIGNVNFADVNQASTSAAGYESHLNDTAHVTAGATYTLTVTGQNSYAGDAVAAWIDFNGDGDFTDAGEQVLLTGETAGPYTGSVVIPANAVIGLTRLRIRLYDDFGGNGIIGPCGSADYGQVEDYTVKIAQCVPVTITNGPSNVSAMCGSSASFTVTTNAGSFPTYQWEYRTSATGTYMNVPNAAPYSGVNTATLTVNPVTPAMNGYQYRVAVSGTCGTIDVSAPATLTVTPLVATVNAPNPSICLGQTQQLTITNINSPSPFSQTFTSGPIALAIPDNNPVGVTSTIPATLPAGAVITGMRVTINLTHTYASDIVFALKAPNNNILNLDYFISGTGNPGANMVNTVISSTGTAALSSVPAPYTGTFMADAVVTGAFGPAGPTGYIPTVAAFSGLYSVPTGNYTLAMYDGGAGDVGTLTSWSLTIDYALGTPSTGVFTGPAGTIFTDAAGTTPYTGTAVNTVYVTPTATGVNNYSVIVSNAICTSGALTIPVTVNAPTAGTPVLSNSVTCAGTNGTLTVSGITGGPGFSYQYQVSTDGGLTYTNLGTATSSPTLTIPAPTTAMSGNKYRVIVTSGACAGTVTSAAATLTVNTIPVVTISAAPLLNLYPGLTTTLTAAVSSATAPIMYQWLLNGVNIPGATSNMYVADVDHEGVYTIRVTDANGCSNATSTPASITIGDSVNTAVLFIYPSPNTGQFSVRYYNDINNGGTAPAVVNVFDEKGARVFTRNYVNGAGYQSMNVDLGLHGKGLYRVELLDLNGNRIKTGSVMVF